MIRRIDSKVWADRSQQTTGNVKIIIPEHHHHHHHRQPKPVTVNRSGPVAVQRIHVNSKTPQRYHEEFIVVDKEKEAATGRWVLNVIAAHEAHQQALKTNKKQSQPNNKKLSFQSRKSSKVEPIEITSVQQTQIQNQEINPYPRETMLSLTTIGDGPTTPLSSFSSASSVEDIGLPGESSVSSPIRSNSQSEDYSTEEFKDDDDRPCISKKIIIACTILSILLIVGIIVAVIVTIFVGKNQSSSSSSNATAKSIDPKSQLLVSLSTTNDMICPTELFNITDPLCHGQVPYQYYSCYQMVTSTTLTIQFAFQHDTMSGHWYFDDISAVQNENLQLIINGGFETNLMGWMVNMSSNSTPDIYLDTMTGLAHTGSAYFNGASKNSPVYIEQTFDVTIGEYINISFWWGYDGGLTIGNTCQAIGQLIPSL